MPDTPHDPITDLAASAVQLHEVYVAHVEAGFTEAQALQIVIGILTAGFRSGE